MPHIERTGEYLSATDAAKVAGVSPQLMRRLVRQGKVPGIDFHVVQLVHRDDAEAYRQKRLERARLELQKMEAGPGEGENR